MTGLTGPPGCLSWGREAAGGPQPVYPRAVTSVDALARIVWDYHRLNHVLRPADAIIVLGSHDTRVAERGAEVFLGGWAPLIVFSGNLGALTKEIWRRPEAEIFAEVARGRGVPPEATLIENRSTNTGENVELSRELLGQNGIRPKRVIAVQKPYMERRTHATFGKRWPEVEVIVTSPQLDFDAYPNDEITREDVIHIMVGDLQRILLYGDKGWQVPQEVPPHVRDAYQGLVAGGYTRRLIPDG
jgi:uncharacterized SAM-binding protein YcdF (DUF218 family)